MQESGPSFVLGLLDWIKIVTGVLGITATLLGAWRLAWPWLRHRWDIRVLKERVGAVLYPQHVFENATHYYVKPLGQVTDPAEGDDPALDRTAKQGLFELVDEFLNKNTESRFLFILAGSGMGKTSFLLNYYVRNARRIRRKWEFVLLPFGIDDFDERLSCEQERANKVLFLDAFDEDTQAIRDHAARLDDVAKSTLGFEKVVVTCRTQFFPSDEELPRSVLAKIEIGPRGIGQKFFHKQYISPLTDEQVKKYIKGRFTIWGGRRRKAKQIVANLPTLSVRPMVLSYLHDLIEKSQAPQTIVHLYDAIISGWLKREVGVLAEFQSVDAEHLLKFSEQLAVDIWLKRRARRMERIQEREMLRLAARWNIPVAKWKLTGRSLLTRDAEHNWKFAHRSFMEFLYVKRLLQGIECNGEDCWPLTDQMTRFLAQSDLSGADLSGANLAEADLRGINLSHGRLEGANLRDANLRGADLSNADLSNARLDDVRLDEPHALNDNATYQALLEQVRNALMTGKPLDEFELGVTAVHRPLLVNGHYINGPGADLTRANLQGAKLTGANLSGANLRNANLSRAILVGSNIEAARLDPKYVLRHVLDVLNPAERSRVFRQSSAETPSTDSESVINDEMLDEILESFGKGLGAHDDDDGDS